MTCAVAAAVAPLAAVQVMVYDLVAVSAPVDSVPLVALAPVTVQSPEAEHDAALVVAHVRSEALPEASVGGAAVSVTVGFGTGLTPTVTDRWVAPTALPHWTVNTVAVVSTGVSHEPAVGTNSAPMAHEVALAVVQVRVARPL